MPDVGGAKSMVWTLAECSGQITERAEKLFGKNVDQWNVRSNTIFWQVVRKWREGKQYSIFYSLGRPMLYTAKEPKSAWLRWDMLARSGSIAASAGSTELRLFALHRLQSRPWVSDLWIPKYSD